MFEDFKRKYEKNYPNAEEEDFRFAIFQASLKDLEKQK